MHYAKISKSHKASSLLLGILPSVTSTGWGIISLGTVGVAVSRLKPHLSNFGSLLKLQRLIFPESLGMIK